MVWKKPTQITSWSFTRYNDYQKCPAFAGYKHVKKIPEPGSPAMTRGADIGKQAEAYVKGTAKKLIPELKTFESLFKELRAQFKKRPQSMVVEDTWALRKDWSRTVWNDWDGCHLRVKVDVARLIDGSEVMEIIDWKTGKFKEDKNEEYLQQLELYATAALQLNPEVKEVRCSLKYTDLGLSFPNDGPKIFVRADLPKLKKEWDKRTRAMLLDKTFAPRPNSHCRWCWYGQSKKADGGPGLCKF